MNNPEYKNYIEKENPGTKKILDQFRQATRSGGAIFGVVDQFRSIVAAEVTRMIEKDYTPEQAIAVIKEKTNEAIAIYNRTVQ